MNSDNEGNEWMRSQVTNPKTTRLNLTRDSSNIHPHALRI
jgi:hypothetical protein